MFGTLRGLMIRIFRARVLAMCDHQPQAVVVIVLLLLHVLTNRVEGLRQLDRLLQPRVEAVVRLVSESKAGCLALHVDEVGVERRLDRVLVPLVESYVPLVKAVLPWHVVVVDSTADVVVVAAATVVVVADVERLHQLCILILK